MTLDQHIYEYRALPPGYDENTNDGHGWEAGQMQCGYCGYTAAYVWPADADPDILACPKCHIRAIEPDDAHETIVRPLPGGTS